MSFTCKQKDTESNGAMSASAIKLLFNVQNGNVNSLPAQDLEPLPEPAPAPLPEPEPEPLPEPEPAPLPEPEPAPLPEPEPAPLPEPEPAPLPEPEPAPLPEPIIDVGSDNGGTPGVDLLGVDGIGSIWVSPADPAVLPVSGSAWKAVPSKADDGEDPADVSDGGGGNSNHDTATLAAALVCVRLSDPVYCNKARGRSFGGDRYRGRWSLARCGTQYACLYDCSRVALAARGW